jgi:endonuclease/exonuclease/phosphatase family metal-dependent hydrolase
VTAVEHHTLALDSNVDGKWFPTQHTWYDCSSGFNSEPQQNVEVTVNTDGTTEVDRRDAMAKLRLVSFNVWNSNPPKWLWRMPMDRYRQYAFRMHHLGDVLRMADADIFTLQEVRLDTSLGGRDDESATDEVLAGKKTFLHALHTASDWYNRTRKISELVKYHERNMAKWTGVVNSPKYAELCAHHPFEECLQPDAEFNRTVSNFVSSFRRGFLHFPSMLAAQRKWPHSQIKHISAHLPGFQYVSRAGQFYMDPEAWIRSKQRDEEGPAIFSKHPIVDFDYLLLSRDPNDGDDGHQRICLHAVISVPTSVGTSVLVDVYTVHLSLSPSARMRSVDEIVAFIASSSRGKLQIFTGDLNAEPLEPAIQKFMQSGVSVGGSAEQVFRDAWLVHNDEPKPQDSDAAVRRYAFTFPSDNPVKRIDYIFLRSDCPECVVVNRTFVLGQDPMPGTEMMEDRGVGMVHDRSPIWASDHRAVATDIVFSP